MAEQPKQTLATLTHDFDELERELFECGGEPDEALAVRFRTLTAELSGKVDRTAFYLSGLLGRAEKLKEWAKRAQGQATALEAHHERLLRYIDTALGEKDSLQGEAFAIVRRQNPGSVEVTDIEALKETCPQVVSVSTEEVVDKKALGAALKASNNIRGAVLKRSHRIQIVP